MLTPSHQAKEPEVSDEQTKPQTDEEQDQDKDVEGHNIFATQDYYTQRNIDRRADIDRDVRERQRAKEAEESKKRR
jgi:hypothetical protein